ncbi:MAG: diguanylate cyclase [Gemmatimonadetes bacterium]|nr:diguanylate cyclase [Gemmatimonadota bacterium]
MAKFKERRSSPKVGRVSGAVGKPTVAGKAAAKTMLRDAAGFHTMEVVREFIQYDLDGGAQTEWNERFVMPLCMAVMSVDNLKKLPNEGVRNRALAIIGETLGKLTRRADRMARSGNDYVVLLRRTLAKRVSDSYGPHMRKAVVDACAEAGMEVVLSIGIASVTEHMIKNGDDMIKKAFAALDHARKQGPGSLAIYDFRIMPY